MSLNPARLGVELLDAAGCAFEALEPTIGPDGKVPLNPFTARLLGELIDRDLSDDKLRAGLDFLSQLPVERSRELALSLGDSVAGQAAFLSHWPGLLRRRLPLIGLKRLTLHPHHLVRVVLPRVPLLLAGEVLPGLGLQVGYWVGGGGGGDLYRGRCDNPGEGPLAIKAMRGPLGSSFAKLEGHVLRQLALRRIRKGIPRLRGCWAHEAQPVLVTRYIPGYTLEELLTFSSWAWQTFTPEKVAELLALLANILEPVHDHGLVHRDLKGANVLLSPRPSGGYALHLLDWGIAGPADGLPPDDWEMGPSTMTTAAKVLQYGKTEDVASPQQLDGAFCCPTDDIYSLGVLAIRTLARQSRTPLLKMGWKRELRRQGAEPWFVRLLDRCVAPERTHRPANAGMLLSCLERHSVQM